MDCADNWEGTFESAIWNQSTLRETGPIPVTAPTLKLSASSGSRAGLPLLTRTTCSTGHALKGPV